MEQSVTNQGMMQPNLFLVGAAKGGTTSIYNYLKGHPDVYMSPLKEPNFFGSDIDWSMFESSYKRSTQLDMKRYLEETPLAERHIAFVQDLEDYEVLFRTGSSYRYRGEASTSYLYSNLAASEIYEYNKDAKIIMILREPVERALSHYYMDYSGGGQKEKDILKAVREDYESSEKGWGKTHLYIELGQYYKQVERYLSVFPKNQLLILSYNDLKNNAQDLMQKVFDFLDLDALDLESGETTTKRFNETTLPRSSFVRVISKYKDILPPFIIDQLRKRKSIFFKPYKKGATPAAVIDYIKPKVEEDWLKVQSFLD